MRRRRNGISWRGYGSAVGLLILASACSNEGRDVKGEGVVHHAEHGAAFALTAEEIARLPPDGGPRYNRLVFEKSPYLLQHAVNPVDWYPWGEEAFEKARRENKPVFLSVGYSTCHWCHVMERESFEDEDVAALLNQNYVCVKVDREERPDIDKIYMDVTQAMTGGGGWPMTVIMTPDKLPFFSGTYFPKRGRHGRPGMMDILPQLSDAWSNQRERIDAVAARAVEVLQRHNVGESGGSLGEATLQTTFQQLASRYDSANGGFAQAPKFPTPHNINFLLNYWKTTGEARALRMVERTLTKMRLGGIYDHIGYGFHRYSTDATWLLPHFEKMLYDQALIANAYLDAYQATGRELFAQTAREIFTYVLRDMTSEEGAFYSAEDADSEGEEGLFYVWTKEQLAEVLSADDALLFSKVYQFREGGNFAEQSTGRKTGQNIPFLTDTLDKVAIEIGMAEPLLRERLATIREELFSAREKRVHPLKDDKVLTDWNGLMIAALAKGARVLGEPAYAQAAERAAKFIQGTLQRESGRLVKRYRQGEAGLPAHHEDYAFVIWGLIELYQTTFDTAYLDEAKKLTDIMLDHFWNAKQGGFFLTADDGEELIVRAKRVYDGAIPSGNSVTALNLLRLARITGHTDYEERADQTMRAFSGTVGNSPSAYTFMMQAVSFAVGPSYEVIVTGDPSREDTRQMIAALHGGYQPHMIVLLKPTGAMGQRVSELAPYSENMTPQQGKATAYVCKNFACNQPTTDIEEMKRSVGLTP